MKGKMIRRDISRNRAVSFTTMLFIAAASMLLSLAAILGVSLYGSIGHLMQEAKTPHFMQMHSGGVDMGRLEEFAQDYKNVEAFQVINFLNIDNTQIVIGGHSLSDNVQDNGFCEQSSRFDFLLDLDGRRAEPEAGEVYVPVSYYKDGTAEVSDQVRVNGKAFRIAGFIRDSQMNSTLASSKRFVINKQDYEELEPMGSVEYLIEFRLKDLSKLGTFETDYSAAQLPANGPALTWQLFQMISAVSDGIMIAVILLVSALVVLIALLCIRFTLLAKIEEDYREIGVMKAVGMRLSDIRGIYLATYTAITALGTVAGFLLSLVLKNPLQESIRLNLGESGNKAFGLLVGGLGVCLLFLFILFYVSRVLRRFGKISAAAAIRFGAGQGGAKGAGILKLSGNRLLPANLFLGIKDVLVRKRLYMTMLVVVVLACFIMIVPQNMYHTISDKRFVAYLGVGNSDLRLDIQQTEEIDEKAADIGSYMKNDPSISHCTVLSTKVYQTELQDGTTENLKVELGDHSVFPLQYAEGRLPKSDGEIALSALCAEDLGKTLGSQITLKTSQGERQFTVCGIYSDITNGGKTAKAAFQDHTANTAWSTVCAALTDQNLKESKAAEYKAHFGYAKVSDIEAYMAQTFGQTMRSVRSASITAMFVATAVMLLVTLLFMKLMAAKDMGAIAVMRAVGFTGPDIIRQYMVRTVVVTVLGILFGTVLAGTLGEKLASAAISSLGAADFHFTVHPLSAWVLCPAILLSVALLGAVWGTRKAAKVSISESMKE